jgi:hypothetical protein
MVEFKCSRCGGDGMVQVLRFQPLVIGLCDKCRYDDALTRLAEAVRLKDEEVAARPLRPPHKSTDGEWAVRRTMWKMNENNNEVVDA